MIDNSKITDLIKSKSRVRDHAEVFTPDFIVQDMLDLVKQESERIDSRFLEPACGDGNFLAEVLKRKIIVVEQIYWKSQFDCEKNIIVAVSSIYGIDLLIDNIQIARERLYLIIVNIYTKLYKNKIEQKFLVNVQYILSKNIIQGDALSLKDINNKPIVFSERSLVDNSKIKRRDFIFDELINNSNQNIMAQWTLFGDTGEPVFIPNSIADFPPIHFLELATLDHVTQL